MEPILEPGKDTAEVFALDGGVGVTPCRMRLSPDVYNRSPSPAPAMDAL